MAKNIDDILSATLSDILAPLVKAEVDRQLEEREQKVSTDYRCWWSASEVQERYGITPTWLSANILSVPKFQKMLDGFAFNYQGRIGWRFEPTAFSSFMRDHFADIAKEVKDA
ncbi:DUF771 domain-containing protein [Lacticaseibacillus jixiensis]|uniref:DUF771 domain-containing protein n=1 Tax=Lacticaseibacillus jixiensis TaxID=3231926 RepID=UPI0036F2B19E